jgi:hypothetical protein
MRKMLGLEKYTTVSQIEVHAIKTFAVENLGREYSNVNTVAVAMQ